MKRIRIILCCVIGILGSGLCICFGVTHENDYAYYELTEPNQEQLQKIEDIFETAFPEDFEVKSLQMYQTFIPDAWQNVKITYEGNTEAFIESIQNTDLSVSLDEENCVIVSYYDARSNGLAALILENGVKHTEKLIVVCIMQMLLIVAMMIFCLLPYRKIYQKLNGL